MAESILGKAIEAKIAGTPLQDQITIEEGRGYVKFLRVDKHPAYQIHTLLHVHLDPNGATHYRTLTVTGPDGDQTKGNYHYESFPRVGVVGGNEQAFINQVWDQLRELPYPQDRIEVYLVAKGVKVYT